MVQDCYYETIEKSSSPPVLHPEESAPSSQAVPQNTALIPASTASSPNTSCMDLLEAKTFLEPITSYIGTFGQLTIPIVKNTFSFNIPPIVSFDHSFLPSDSTTSCLQPSSSEESVPESNEASYSDDQREVNEGPSTQDHEQVSFSPELQFPVALHDEEERSDTDIDMKYEEHSTQDQTLVAEFLLNLKERFGFQLDLLAEWMKMEAGEVKEWHLWRTDERTLVVTKLWMRKTERRETPAVSVHLVQGSGAVSLRVLHSLQAMGGGGQNGLGPVPSEVERAFRSLDSWREDGKEQGRRESPVSFCDQMNRPCRLS